ncbi:DEAD/DEAH box helicase [Crocinitomicaceae bacterium]|nr:DEAD/DEAH box helicase [Crocinitomicaceae bacterium]MDC1282902.1 DEAD/DEAH box helicase [Crocinitomicaceae bacterium]MDC1384618.1 DEAD/DEAH box helicase [Crocinitomicaceae bacterium]|tara:strand:+ start:5474 stop:6826 length:1353 start_codon:yes stop_codon:yes gene_type:complete
MSSFEDFRLRKQLKNAVDDLGFVTPTPIQEQSFSVVLSGRDVLGIAQTGTGKTLGYMLPLLEELKFSKQLNPRILVLVPTRELVIQVIEEIENFTKYMSVRTIGIYGGVNIKTQSTRLLEGADIVVATPGRLYDLILNQSLIVKGLKKLVIDEVDVMLDLGFRRQITNILELLPEKRQNIMFSATMTDHVDALIDDFFVAPAKISIAVSGTPLDNISQLCYPVENFYTKVNLLKHLLSDGEQFGKVLVFVSNKKSADRLFEAIEPDFGQESCIIHSNKSQNYRIRSIEDFDAGVNRILVSTDIMSRGLDLDQITHVINFDTPGFPENYMHRIGRTGRAEKQGKTILFFTENEKELKDSIEELMDYTIPMLDFPEEVEVSKELTPEEQPDDYDLNENRNTKKVELAPGFHEKKAKNLKTNQGGSYKREIAKKYKKSQTRGDKTYHKKQKRG